VFAREVGIGNLGTKPAVFEDPGSAAARPGTDFLAGRVPIDVRAPGAQTLMRHPGLELRILAEPKKLDRSQAVHLWRYVPSVPM
jgi:hypothetical protein